MRFIRKAKLKSFVNAILNKEERKFIDFLRFINFLKNLIIS